MYKQTSPQLALFEPNNVVPGILPNDDWSFTYRDKIWPLIDEDKFKHLYQEEGGAPNKSIKLCQRNMSPFTGTSMVSMPGLSGAISNCIVPPRSILPFLFMSITRGDDRSSCINSVYSESR